MASVLDLVKHYQHAIEKYPDDEQKILKCIDKLFQLDVTVGHLQETGVGRTVNALRKEPGEVGQAARSLVYKWKLMVAAEESDQEGDHNDSSNYNGHGQEKDSDDNTGGSQTKERSNGNKTKSENKQINGDHSGNKRKYHSSEEEDQDRKRSKSTDFSNRNGYEQKPVIKKEPESNSDNSSDSSESDSESSEEETKPVVKIKTEPKIETEHKSRSSYSSHSDHYTESSAKRPHDSSKHHKSESHHSTEKSSSREKSSSKHKSSNERENSEKHSHRNSDSEKKYKDDSKPNKHSSSTEKHKSSSEKPRSEKHKSSERSSSKSDKHETSKSHKSDKPKHKSSSEKDMSSNKHKSSSSSSKEKHSSSSKESSKEKPKESSRSSKEKLSHSKSEKHSNDSKTKESKSDKSVDRSSEKSKHKSSSSSSKSSSKHKEDIPKKKSKSDSNEDSDDGIGCESGASFAEALGMISPAKPKKKVPEKSKDLSPSDSWNDDLSPANLLAPSAKLAPLPKIEISSLPEISTNYKPRPPPKFLPHFTDEEALNVSISSKNQRTKVYSGNKVIGKVTSLYELCVQVLQTHIDALEYTGGVPYEILKPVVDRATPQQLFVLEHYNPYLMEDTDHLWQTFCEKNFRNKKRQEMETWREMYMRCQEEQEHKLKSLTQNIRIAQEAKKAPIKQTKMAYADSFVKPPRNIARKQAIHGTAHLSSASPAARVASLASSSNVLRGSVRAPPAAVSSTSSFQKKKAPLMQKALQFMRGRKR